MKITLVYDNELSSPNQQNNLIADWGFSAYLEIKGRKFLFDTGGNGKILLNNLCQLDIDPTEITDIFISHGDFDHIGGLSHLLNMNPTAIIHSPQSLRGIRYPNPIKHYRQTAEIYTDIFSSGELGEREQSLFIKTSLGIIIVLGCGHPGVEKILETAQKVGKVYALIGGFHDFEKYEILSELGKVCPTHCTKNKQKISQIFPGKYLAGGVGREIFFSDPAENN